MYLSKKIIKEVMKVFINWMVGILSQCTQISNHHDVNVKYLTIVLSIIPQ